MKKRKIIAMVMALAIVLSTSVVPGTKASASTIKELHKGEIVRVTRTEEQFTFNVDEDGEYTIYSDATGVYSQVKMSIFDQDYKLIKSDSQNFKVNLTSGKYFVKIESRWGIPLDFDFGVIADIKINDIEKIEEEDNTTSRVYKLSYNKDNNEYLGIETFSNQNDEEDTIISLYNSKGSIVYSNDDMSDKSKFSSLYLGSKVKFELLNGDDYYIKVEAKDKNKPLTTGLVLNDKNIRHDQYIEFISPEEEGYFLKDENITFSLYGSPAVSSIKMKYKAVGVESDDKWNVLDLGVLYKDEKTNTFREDIKATIKYDLNVKVSSGVYNFPTFLAQPKGQWNQDNGEKELEGYITMLRREKYMQMDKSWYYNSPYDHPFVNFGTNEYNCYAYSLDMNDQNYGIYRIPESIYNYNDFDKFIMEWQYRSGPAFLKTSDKELPYSDLIAYGISNHFAKVSKWDNAGKPTKIISKWGQAELIESNPYDLVGYGEASFWASGKYTPNRAPR